MRFNIYVFAILLAAISVIGAFVLRKELPYQFDVIRTDAGVAVVNQDTWNQRLLSVTVRQNGRKITTGILDPKNHSEVFQGMPETGEVDLEITRADLMGRIRYKAKTIPFRLPESKQAYAVLVGASIGRAWRLEDFGHRFDQNNVVFSSRAHYEFDKTDTLMSLLSLKVKPDAIILKECSDYFPRDFEQSAAKLRQWVERIKKSGIQPILATTTPVSNSGPRKERQPAIDQWNTFLRDYGQNNQIAVLDLAGALQISADNTYIKEGYSKDDGYHLTSVAYRQALDPLLKKFTDLTLSFQLSGTD